jgi:hypothetical protein
MSKPDWENFAKAVLADWPTGDLEGSVLFDLALQYGMIQEVPGGYNSDHHFDADGVGPEEGDPWYEYTFRGEAGPGLYSIHVLTEQLEAARADAKEAEAYAEELEKDRNHWQDVAGREGVCMTCRGPKGAPEPYGCSDCFNTGYCGEWHNEMGELREKLAKAVELLRRHCDPMDMSNADVATLAEIEGSDAP